MPSTFPSWDLYELKKNTWTIAFKTMQGLYEWYIIPFGLCNDLTIFVCFLNYLLHPFLDSFAIAYLDDMLVYIANWFIAIATRCTL